MREKFLTKIKTFLCETVGFEEQDVNENSRFHEDLMFDSLDEVELIMELEKEYNIAISDEEAEKFKTVKDVIDYLERRVK